MGTLIDHSNISIGMFLHSLEPSQYRYLSTVSAYVHIMFISGIKIYTFRNIPILITDMGTVLNQAKIVINHQFQIC